MVQPTTFFRIKNASLKLMLCAVLLTVLCTRNKEEELAGILLKETSTLGIRRSLKSRYTMDRKIISVCTGFGDVRVKVATYGKFSKAAPTSTTITRDGRLQSICEGPPGEETVRRGPLGGPDGRGERVRRPPGEGRSTPGRYAAGPRRGAPRRAGRPAVDAVPRRGGRS
jgi:hypothetical protein